MRASVFVIGPLDVLRKHDVLCYADDYYEEAPKDAVVLGCVAQANTNDQSRQLAKICETKPFLLWNHKITRVIPGFLFYEQYKHILKDYVGEQTIQEIYEKIVDLLEEADVQLWYEPNG